MEEKEFTPNTKPQVLIAEDDPAVLKLLQATISLEPNLDVTSCKTPAETRQLLENPEKKYDLFITDRSLTPDKDTLGYDLAKLAKKRNTLCQVIMVTASKDQVTKQIQEEYGIDKVVAKPFSPRAFLQEVKSSLEKAKSQ